MIAKKRFGQNFLQNPHILDQIVSALSLQITDRILEVGPGPSYLTRLIIPKVCSYYAIEIDHQFQPILKSLEKENKNFHYVIDDFLKTPIRTYQGCNKFVGNLPYNISSPILFKLAAESNVELLVCMFALGTAERFLAIPGSLHYSAGSIMAQSFFQVEKILDVSRTQFMPVPKVDSAVLRFTRKTGNQKNLISFNNWVQPLFSYRRKTIMNSLLQSSCSKEKAVQILTELNIKPTDRIENLSLTLLTEMFRVFESKDQK